jgi:predicted permease
MRHAFDQDYAAAAARGPAARRRFVAAALLRAACFGTLERLPKGPVMRSFIQFDLTAAIRSLRATPVITAVAIASLALGIGANTALFSILNGLVLKPLPVRAPQDLAFIDDGDWTNPIWEAVRERAPEFADGAFAWSATSFDMAASGEVDRVSGATASGSLFKTLGLTPALGRFFDTADDARGFGPDGPVVVISERLWRQRFEASPDAIGRTLLLNRKPFRVVGVMPAAFTGLDVGRVADVVVPIATDQWLRGADHVLDNRSTWWLQIYLRRPSNRTFEEMTSALNALRPAIREATLPSDWPARMQAQYMSEPLSLTAASTGQSALRDRYAEPLTIILVVVGAVLVIACANIANLLLVRATARRHEMSVRLALGASRLRLARQLLTESLLLAAAGGIAGLALAQVGGRLVVQQLSTSVSTVSLSLTPDLRVLAFTAGVSLVTALLFGLMPAFGLSRVSPNDALKEQSRGAIGDRRFGLRNVLVVAQVALSLALVIAAGLFVRTFASMASTPLGFEPAPLMVTTMDIRETGASGDERLIMARRTLDAALATPGVRHAGLSLITPLSGSGWNGRAKVEGQPFTEDKSAEYWVNPVSPGWFQTYGMHIVRGRDISRADVKGSEPVVVVNETFARKFLPGDPLSHRVIADLDGGEMPFRVIGVVSDAIYRNVRAGVVPTTYFPFQQLGRPGTSFNLTTDVGQSAEARRALAASLAGLDARVSFAHRDLNEQVRATMAQERLVAVLSGFFGALALLLAGLGLYGVTSFAVSRRTNEIAVRMALGAPASSVVRMVLRSAGLLLAAGAVAGIALALWTSTFVGSLLFGLTPRDPFTIGAAVAALAVTALVAAWLPARRAARLDPTAVLRQ